MTRDPQYRIDQRSVRGAAAVAVSAALLLVVLCPVASAVWPPWMAQDEPEPVYPDVTASVDDVRSSMGRHDVVFIDARPSDDYARGHIPGAVSMPVPVELPGGGLPSGNISAVLGAAGLPGDARYICYGANTLSDPAAYVFWLLEAGGASRVQLLDGGYVAWTASGGRAETEPRRLTPAVWTRGPSDTLLASHAYVRERYGVRGHEIIDSRSRPDWEAGHIPHSLQFDFEEFLEDGMLLPAEECREIFSMTGPRPASPVRLSDEFIVHGVGGESGAIGYFMLRRAGLAAVRYHPGGWHRWSADEALPVVRFIGGEELNGLVSRANRWPWQDAPPESFVLIDVRHEGDYANGHIPGSVVLTSRLFADSLDVYLDRYWPGIDRETTPIVTYCYGPTCIRSRHTSTDAARAGFRNIWRFYGGLEEWRAVGGRMVE